jgi:NAD(P)H-dependent FMN reductase
VPRNAIRILIVDGSLRADSHNRMLARLADQAIQRLGAQVRRATIADFDVPLYSQDVEMASGIALGARRFCDALKGADAFLLASPEYNASMSGVMKNLIDWTSRIRPQPFNGKQGMLFSASPSMAGGNRGLWALRVPLEHLGARIYPDMFSLAQSHQAFRDDGTLKNDVLAKRLDDTISCFLDLVEAATHYPALKKQWVEFLGEQPDRATDRVETSDAEAA